MLSSYRKAKESVLLVTLNNYENGTGDKTRSKIQEDTDGSKSVMLCRKICPSNGMFSGSQNVGFCKRGKGSGEKPV